MVSCVREIREYQRIRRLAGWKEEEKTEREREREREREKRDWEKLATYYRVHIYRHVHFRASDPRERRLFTSRHLLAKPAGVYLLIYFLVPRCVPYLLPLAAVCASSSFFFLSSLFPPFFLSFSFISFSSLLFLFAAALPPDRRGVFAFRWRSPSTRALKFLNTTGTGKQKIETEKSTLLRRFLGSALSCFVRRGRWDFTR